MNADRTQAMPAWPRAEQAEAFAPASVRLSGREWLAAGVLVAAVLAGLLRLWPLIERFEPPPNYRVPYEWSNDYWLVRRHAARAAAAGDVLVLGDSVIWGRYVTPERTLSGCLAELYGQDGFANLGVNGLHPVALAGFLKHYGQDVTGAAVILHCNLLWFASGRHDLREPEPVAFNHPGLVPQFWPRIGAYGAPLEDRLAAVADRDLAFRAWAAHVRIAYFDGLGVPAWSLEHPYDNPLDVILRRTYEGIVAGPAVEYAVPVTRPVPRALDLPWVSLEQSLQWRGFTRAIEILRRRHNRVFVLVGPFNEWILEPGSRGRCRQTRDQIAAWLRAREIPYHVAATPPADYFADASHLTAAGHVLLARRMLADEAFAAFLRQDRQRRRPALGGTHGAGRQIPPLRLNRLRPAR